jgi:hypothetical protein
MPEEQQIDLFAPPIALEVAATLPEWFRIQRLADALGYESHFDAEFRDTWYAEVFPHLEERKVYIAGDECSGNYRGFFDEYRLAATDEHKPEVTWIDY